MYRTCLWKIIKIRNMDSNELFVKSIPVYYISFNKNTNIENSLNNVCFKMLIILKQLMV